MRWKIAATSCGCGGSWAWLVQRESGAWEMAGCVCHHEGPGREVELEITVVPPPPVPLTQEEKIASRKRWDEAVEKASEWARARDARAEREARS